MDASLTSIVSQVDAVLQDASLLSLNVKTTARTAERLSKRVQALDDEMGRVRAAADYVGQIMELKSSLDDLQSAIDDQDWEAAARHCARAMSIPPEVTGGVFAEKTIPTSERHLPPAQMLQETRMNLLNIFRRKFDQASRSRDSTATSRFFKLFPAIGCEEEGLNLYASFAADLVRIRVPASEKSSSPLYYVTMLTVLFESIAMIVDQHQPVVKKYYGLGKMRYVTQRLLSECDRVVKDTIDAWEEDRAVKQKLSDTLDNQPVFNSSYTARRPVTSTVMEEDIVDPRDIDRILSELAGMIGRWNLFRKFLIESVDDEVSESNVPTVSETQSTPIADSSTTSDSAYIYSTSSSKRFDQLMTTYYIPLETWYIRASITKAHLVSSADISQSTPTTTAPDDVFYLLKIVISRLLSTGAFERIGSLLGHIRDIIEQDHIGIIKKKSEDIYRASGTSTSRSEKTEKDNRIAFVTILNDLDISSTHMERLIHDLSGSETIKQHFTEEHQIMVKSQLNSLSNLTTKIRATQRSGVEQMFNQLVRPKLRTLIPDVYRDVSYMLDDERYSAAEQQDIVRKRFIKSWEGFGDGYQETFTENNYRIFFGLALDSVLRPWEKLITTLRFTELGAIRFDRDLRSIVTFLATHGDAREKFARLQQISTLLNLDSEEDVDEFYNSSGITWRMNLTEAKTIAGLKV